MILTGSTLKELFTNNTWKCNKSVNSLHFNPNSIDVTLSPHIYKTKLNPYIIDPISNNVDLTKYFELVTFKEYILKPQEFVLASVNEAFDVNAPYKGKYFTQIYDGRSTMARLGILSHISAGFGDYGFKGAFTLEIVNNSPFYIKLHADMRVGQVYFSELDDKASSLVYEGYTHANGIPGLPRLGSNRF